jgi:3-dehydroquinate dehydratase-2
MRILVLHGPNLNVLGEREPKVYGTMTLARLNTRLRAHARKRKAVLRIFQDNCEGALIDLLHENRRWAQGVVLNPGAYSHYSYALRDAVAAIGIPVIEVHLTDVKKREAFRRKSVIAPACRDEIHGKGLGSYLEAVDRLCALPRRAPLRRKAAAA